MLTFETYVTSGRLGPERRYICWFEIWCRDFPSDIPPEYHLHSHCAAELFFYSGPEPTGRVILEFVLDVCGKALKRWPGRELRLLIALKRRGAPMSYPGYELSLLIAVKRRGAPRRWVVWILALVLWSQRPLPHLNFKITPPFFDVHDGEGQQTQDPSRETKSSSCITVSNMWYIHELFYLKLAFADSNILFFLCCSSLLPLPHTYFLCLNVSASVCLSSYFNGLMGSREMDFCPKVMKAMCISVVLQYVLYNCLYQILE